MIKAVTLLIALAVVPSGGGYKTFSGGGVSFRYPATWHVQRESVQGMHFHPVADLGTDALHSRCSESPSGKSCGWPVEQLSPGGMLALVSVTHMPPTRGVVRWPMKLGGYGAAVTTSRPGGCAEIGGDLTVDASIAVNRGSSAQILICAKSPGLERSRRQAMRLLRSLRNR